MSFTRTLDTANPWCGQTFFPAPEGQPVKRLKHQIHGAKQEKLYPEEEGSQYKYKLKIPEGQVYAPRLEPTAPIRLADGNHAQNSLRRCLYLY